MASPKLLWQPTKAFIETTHIKKYMSWLAEKYQLFFEDYDELWRWSIENTTSFWQSIWEYFELISYSDYEEIHSSDPMPKTKWFSGSHLNYAAHIFRKATEKHPAIIFQSERHALTEISWKSLQEKVAALAFWMKEQGVQKGDRVVAYLPNIPEATIAFLATCSLGAIWSSSSPDFGPQSIIDRFQQIEPKLLFAVDGYQYNGKPFDKKETVKGLTEKLTTLQHIVLLPYLNPQTEAFLPNSVLWDKALSKTGEELTFEEVPFDHPIWVLYSSGTTGIPKAITHSHGGALLEHLKYLTFHNDVHPGERFFWYSTTGWMMWNFVQASLLSGATIVLYDGSPGYPNMNVLWSLAQNTRMAHFGTSAPYIVACMKKGLTPGSQFDLSALRSIGSTGAPLPPEGFSWVYEQVKRDLWLCSMSGGTDVCTAFVGGVPTEAVYEGEIQRRALGCAMFSFDEEGKPIKEEVGEMVITKPMPSMPIFFWNDPDNKRYLDSYFGHYAGVWRHGDWLKITNRNTLVILGRSDATLNRHGVRIGTAEIYRAMNVISAIKDSLIVNLELEGGRHYMPLFVVLHEIGSLDAELKKAINQTLRQTYSPRHVPDDIIEVKDIPYTISGKKLEAPVKKILLGVPLSKAANKGAMKNPESLDFFVEFISQIPT